MIKIHMCIIGGMHCIQDVWLAKMIFLSPLPLPEWGIRIVKPHGPRPRLLLGLVICSTENSTAWSNRGSSWVCCYSLLCLPPSEPLMWSVCLWAGEPENREKGLTQLPVTDFKTVCLINNIKVAQFYRWYFIFNLQRLSLFTKRADPCWMTSLT